MTILAIDGGASAAKWRLQSPDGQALAEGKVGPLHGHIYTQEDAENARFLLKKIRAALPANVNLRVVVGGIAGLATSSPATRWYFEEIQKIFGVSAKQSFVSDDLGMVYLGNFDPGNGMVLYAGTGAIACHITRDFKVLRAGGFGFLVDDAGGGFWIGRTALRAFLRALEDTPDATASPLYGHLVAHFGTSDWDQLKPMIYDGARPFIAALTQQVNAAARDGDPEALAILRDAGYELADLANRLGHRIVPQVHKVAFLGGITNIGGFVIGPVLQRLDKGLTLLDRPVGDAHAMCIAAEKYGPAGLRRILS